MSMSVYEIDQALLGLVDPETGEILDFEAFEKLGMEREQKCENIACWVKDLDAEAKAIGEEIKALQARKKAAENKAGRLKEYLTTILAGEKFKSTRCAVSYRKSEAVEVAESFVEWAKKRHKDLLIVKLEPNKTAIKEYLAAGHKCGHAGIVERISTIIK